MKILVTGGSGFLGTHIKAFFDADDMSRRSGLDILNLNDVRRVGEYDVVIHLAAEMSKAAESAGQVFLTNIEGTVNILQSAMRCNVERVLQTSTSEVYGSARTVPISEAHPLQGQSPYSASKIGADKIAESFHLSFGLPVVTVRPFNTFGPRQSARAVIPTIITQAFNGSEIRLGNLEPTRDLNFVADTVEGFIKAAETPKAIGETINLGSGREISIRDLAALILKLMNRDLPIALEGARVRPENSEVDRLCADSRKGQSILGWTPKYSLEDGLTATIEWIRENSERYRTGIYVI